MSHNALEAGVSHPDRDSRGPKHPQCSVRHLPWAPQHFLSWALSRAREASEEQGYSEPTLPAAKDSAVQIYFREGSSCPCKLFVPLMTMTSGLGAGAADIREASKLTGPPICHDIVVA